jgi:hypothetical protein
MILLVFQLGFDLDALAVEFSELTMEDVVDMLLLELDLADDFLAFSLYSL